MTADASRYLIALGSNQRHARYGSPRAIVKHAIATIAHAGCMSIAQSPIVLSRPIGPSQRDYVNCVVLIESELDPAAILSVLQEIEIAMGRIRTGRTWRARTLDLDIILWDGGGFENPDLIIPHPQFRNRQFVLSPAAAIAGDWCDPVTHLTLRQLKARLTRPRPILR